MHKFVFGLFLLVFMSSCASVQDRSPAADGDKTEKKSEADSKTRRTQMRERP